MISLLDSSAVLATILGETGGDVAFAAMADGAISVVNLCEIHSKLIENGASIEVAEREVRRFNLRTLPFSERHAICAAALRPATKRLGLSLGDRACLAHGLVDALPIVTADTKWAALDLGLDIRLIR